MARSSAASAPQHGQRSAPCSLPSSWPPTTPTPPLHRPYTAPKRAPAAKGRRGKVGAVVGSGRCLPRAAAVADAPAPRRWPSMRTAHSFLTLLPAYHGTYQATPPCTASRPTRCSPSDSTRSSACARSLSSPSSPPLPAGSAIRSAERGDVKSRRRCARQKYTLLQFFSILLGACKAFFGFCLIYLCAHRGQGRTVKKRETQPISVPRHSASALCRDTPRGGDNHPH